MAAAVARRNTDDYPLGRFRPHGSVEVSFDGRIMRFESAGPFNAELMATAGLAMRDVLKELPPAGPWWELVRLHGSALISMEVLPALEKLIVDLRNEGLQSEGTAIVAEQDVDGFKLMIRPYLAVYSANGRTAEVFANYAEAEQWIESRLQGTP